MPRFVIDVSYNGTNYSGWERQANAGETIQNEVEMALSKVLRVFTGIYGAGRTDSGVHALQMPAHFDFHEENLHPAFMIAVNAVLPDSIAVMKTYRAVRDNFHARFNGIWRSYEYKIVFQKSPLLYNQTYFSRKKPDFDLLQRAAEVVMEYDSFESFCKAKNTSKTYICHMKYAYWEWQDNVLVFKVKANRFLRGMVRTMVGTMLRVGNREITLEGFRQVIEARDRKKAGMAVFPGGLCLTGVGYKDGELIPYEENR